MNGGRHDVVPGTPKEYKNLYTECWDYDLEKRPISEECYHRLLNIMGKLKQLQKCDSNQNNKIKYHSLSNEMSALYNKLLLKGKSQEQIAYYTKSWLIQNNDKYKSPLTTLKTHTDCGQCSWLIGFFYAHGIKTETDFGQAVKWYQQSAKTGYAAAQCSLGLCYFLGTGVEKNNQKAFELYQKAAEQGYVRAQHNLGSCYSNGIGVEKNIQKAVELYQKATSQGFAAAKYNLGIFYNNGIGVKKNIKKGAELYQKAAEQGYTDNTK